MTKLRKNILMNSGAVNFYRADKFIGSAAGGCAAVRMYENIIAGFGFVSTPEKDIQFYPAEVKP